METFNFGTGLSSFSRVIGRQELRLELKGDPLGGGISACGAVVLVGHEPPVVHGKATTLRSAVLRLYLWPLTQWNVANACTVMCIAHDQAPFLCKA